MSELPTGTTSSSTSIDQKNQPKEGGTKIVPNKKDNPEPMSSQPVAKRQRKSPSGYTEDNEDAAVCDEDGIKTNKTSSTEGERQSFPSRPTTVPTLKTSTLYIGNLHTKVAKIHLEKLMQKYGTIERLHTKMTSTTYFAFCEMKSIEEAQRAMQSLDGVTLLGKRLVVKPAHDSYQGQGSSSGSHGTQQSGGGDSQSKPTARSLQNQQQQLEAKIAQLKRKIGGDS